MARRKPWIYASPECQGKSTEFKDYSANILDGSAVLSNKDTEILDFEGQQKPKTAVLDQAAESLDEATESVDKGADRTDSAAVFMDDGTRLTDKRARISDSAAEFLDYGSRCMPRRAGFTHGNFGFGVRFLLDDAPCGCRGGGGARCSTRRSRRSIAGRGRHPQSRRAGRGTRRCT